MIRTTLFFVVFLAGCAPSITDTDFFREHPTETNPENTLVELGVIEDGRLTIHLSAPDSLRVGASILWAEATVDGSPVSGGSFTVLARWVAGTRMVVSPLGAVKLADSDTPGRFEGIPLFVAPHGDEGHWQLQITYAAGGESGEAILPVDIQSSIWVQYTDGYYVSWVQPVRPVTGLDVIEFAMHRLVEEDFLPLENARIDLFPWMDMGAGQGHSTPYEAPVHVSHGRYRGSVNFIMSGGWEMTVFIERPGAAQDTVQFNGFTVY
ncbi:MAG: hypothetical protein F4069_09190 [Rhodothermaceae bacterium]|nr:hypothetical protein [Rhodothermaceae bacterium]MYG70546.1 hypothetical protein [Rhodothermaceae bacterium]MYJ45481.1 hypothetical protein [Rhodothermaceae bacterium]